MAFTLRPGNGSEYTITYSRDPATGKGGFILSDGPTSGPAATDAELNARIMQSSALRDWMTATLQRRMELTDDRDGDTILRNDIERTRDNLFHDARSLGTPGTPQATLRAASLHSFHNAVERIDVWEVGKDNENATMAVTKNGVQRRFEDGDRNAANSFFSRAEQVVNAAEQEPEPIVVTATREQIAAAQAEEQNAPATPRAPAAQDGNNQAASSDASDSSNPGGAENSNGSRAGNYGRITMAKIESDQDGTISFQTANMQGALNILGLYEYSQGNNNIDGRDGPGTRIAAQDYAEKYMEPRENGQNHSLDAIYAHMSEQLRNPSSQASKDMNERLSITMQVIENDVDDATENSRRAVQGALNMSGDHNLTIDGKIGTGSYRAYSAETTEFTAANRAPATEEAAPVVIAPQRNPLDANTAVLPESVNFEGLLFGGELGRGQGNRTDGIQRKDVNDNDGSHALLQAEGAGRAGVIRLGADNQIYLTTRSSNGDAIENRITELVEGRGVDQLGLSNLMLDPNAKATQAAGNILQVMDQDHPNFDASQGVMITLRDNDVTYNVWARQGANGAVEARIVGDQFRNDNPELYARVMDQTPPALRIAERDLQDFKGPNTVRDILDGTTFSVPAAAVVAAPQQQATNTAIQAGTTIPSAMAIAKEGDAHVTATTTSPVIGAQFKNAVLVVEDDSLPGTFNDQASALTDPTTQPGSPALNNAIYRPDENNQDGQDQQVGGPVTYA